MDEMTAIVGALKVLAEMEETGDTATVRLGDATWHDGPGWYYVIDDRLDEGSCGAFATSGEAIAHAEQSGYIVRNKESV